MTRLAATAFAAASAPSLALACPQCAGRAASPWTVALLGGMIVLPFLIAGVVVRAIRHADHPHV